MPVTSKCPVSLSYSSFNAFLLFLVNLTGSEVARANKQQTTTAALFHYAISALSVCEFDLFDIP